MIKMPLGTEVGLGPDDIVLDKDPAPLLKKWAEPPSPIFGPFLLWPKGWMHQDATCYRDRPQRSQHCITWRLSAPLQKGAETPNFRSMFIVAKRLDGSRYHLVWR